MTINKLAIIGGSGLYDVEEFKNRELLDLNTPWGKPSDQILKTNYNYKEVYFLPRHGRGHFISPSKINFRANIDALKQLGVTDMVSVSAVGSLKEDLPPGKFVIVDQFIDRTFARIKTFFDDEIVAHVSMVTDFDCWHPDHENVDVQQVIKVLLGNAEKAKVMIKNLIDNFEDHIDPNDPTNNCLDVAIITAPEKRTKKTIDKLKTVAGRVLSK